VRTHHWREAFAIFHLLVDGKFVAVADTSRKREGAARCFRIERQVEPSQTNENLSRGSGGENGHAIAGVNFGI
jgi:hypothetical protein